MEWIFKNKNNFCVLYEKENNAKENLYDGLLYARDARGSDFYNIKKETRAKNALPRVLRELYSIDLAFRTKLCNCLDESTYNYIQLKYNLMVEMIFVCKPSGYKRFTKKNFCNRNHSK